MRIRCINRAFRDLSEDGKPLRRIGDEWEAPASRVAEINSAGYGVMAEEVAEAAPWWDAKTRSELLDIASEMGLKPASKATKAQLVAMIDGE